MNTGLARTEATLASYDDAIFLTEEGFVSEGGTSNLVMIRDGILITPPPYMDILEGITLESVLTIGKDMGMSVSARPISRSELFGAEEVFICGTTSEITAVSRIDHRFVGNGKPGPVTLKLQEEFAKIVQGKNEKYLDWLDPLT